MKKLNKLFLLFSLIVTLVFLVFNFTACGNYNDFTNNNTSNSSTNNGKHTHSFSAWNTTTIPSCTSPGMQTRTCSSCGFSQYSPIVAIGHTEVIDKAVSVTCTTDGKTEGKHCSVCNAVIIEQKSIQS